ncbi:long-chain fatty acid--CoA ligase [soil metagenome]
MQFTQGLIRAAQQTPDRLSTLCDGRRRGFTETRDRVARLAAGLRSLGVGPGSHVAALSFNSDYLLEAYLAIAWSGAVMVPVNFRWSAAEIAFSLIEAECDALLVGADHLEMADDLRARCPDLRQVVAIGRAGGEGGWTGGETLIGDHAPMADACPAAGKPLGIFYTGGTTGKPKGVILSHASLCLCGLGVLSEGLHAPGGTALQIMPMFHAGGMMQFISILLRGNSQIIFPSFRPDQVLDAIERYSITDAMFVPSMMQALLDHPAIGQHDVSSLSRVSYGASPASETLIRRFIQGFPNAQLVQGYGLTEAGGYVSALPWSEHLNGGEGRLRSAGRATVNANVLISDGAGGEAKRGDVGEILIRGPGVMSGYLKRPEETAEALRDGWLYSGDVGYMDEGGYIFIVDRAKDMIISGGENVYSTEVENAVASHPAVQMCAVFGVPSEQYGEGVHAAIVLREGGGLTIEQLQAHCRPIIAGYKLPRSLEILESLPLSGAGKVLKTELRARHWAGRERMIG